MPFRICQVLFQGFSISFGLSQRSPPFFAPALADSFVRLPHRQRFVKNFFQKLTRSLCGSTGGNNTPALLTRACLSYQRVNKKSRYFFHFSSFWCNFLYLPLLIYTLYRPRHSISPRCRPALYISPTARRRNSLADFLDRTASPCYNNRSIRFYPYYSNR